MPAHPKPAAMPADELRALLDAAGLTLQRAAALLGVHTNSVQRWAQGETPIAAEKAALIRERLQADKPSEPTG